MSKINKRYPIFGAIDWIIIGVFVLILVFAIVRITSAAPAPKVFVCKYVGKLGVDETLQTGQNPIIVSSNAIQNYQGVGSSFTDQQGRSFVIAEDTGQVEPSCSEPDNPSAGETPNPETPAVDETPTVIQGK